MLLNPTAVRRLKAVTTYTYWPYTTHAQRNEFARMFNEEAARLLDQKAESTIKHAVELYSAGEVPYEEYIELIEAVSKEEEERGASYGGEYARNRVFDFAQKALDQAKDQAYKLSLVEAKRQYEAERQKTEQSLKAVVEQYLSDVATITQQHDADLKTITQAQKEEIFQHHTTLLEHTKVEVTQVVAGQLQDERARREQEIRAQEDRRPAREAARTAAEHIAAQERKFRSHKWLKIGLTGFVLLLSIAFFFALLLLPYPRWLFAIALSVIVAIIVFASLWKSPVSENTIAVNRRELALYQTKSNEYTPLSEEERCALFAQRIL